ncbi:hypothetical protein BDZ97DRAFT_1733671 [Flammula alnicola]|nr:hypothetical protein BDZ97DRAFT_1733671 [Flammula alnicola]
MGYRGLWANRGMLKIDSINLRRIRVAGGQIYAKLWQLTFTNASSMLVRGSFESSMP